jgi:hypothetical protein
VSLTTFSVLTTLLQLDGGSIHTITFLLLLRSKLESLCTFSAASSDAKSVCFAGLLQHMGVHQRNVLMRLLLFVKASVVYALWCLCCCCFFVCYFFVFVDVAQDLDAHASETRMNAHSLCIVLAPNVIRPLSGAQVMQFSRDFQMVSKLFPAF